MGIERGGAVEAAPGASTPGTPRTPRTPRVAEALFWVALLVHASPPWLLTYFPTQDGPLHVENVLAFLHLERAEVLQRHLVANWGLQPNWLTQGLFAGLTALVSPLAAQRLVLTGYLALLPLAVRCALPATAGGRWTALAIFPFLYSFPFHMGFWNFTYGLALVLLVIAAWQRRRGRLTPGGAIGFALLLTLAYFCHTIAVSASLVAIGAVIAWRGGLGLVRARGNARRRRVVVRGYARRLAVLGLAASPALILLARFLARHEDHRTLRLPALAMAAKLMSLYTLVSVDRRELLFSLPVALAVGAAVVTRLVRRRAAGGAPLRAVDGWLLAALAFVVLYFATPDVAAAGAQISDRLALLPYLAVIVWLGSAAGPEEDARRLACALLLLSLGAIALRAPRWRDADRDLAEYASVAGSVERGTVLLPITLAPYGLARDGGRQAWRVRVFQHAAGYVAAERDALDLDDSQANTDHCPLRFAPGSNPFPLLGPGDALEGDPPCVNLAAWREAGGRLDTVLLFGATAANTASPCARDMLATLAAEYDRIAVSRPRGLVQVFRARASPAPPARTASR